ncbi:GGDEF domain-containing protein [Dyella sp. 2HG41-7]|uniref:GGDEF domain-containing protein n=1 Tax=Dyella sp. 2HG41-7 TaxID=2883239 RepID=UPI001F213101|nr:GGDEF domain-containing protein [Dyella sp. 2HG41-7]
MLILLAWFIHGVRPWFPRGWYLMKFDTASGMFLSALSLGLLSAKYSTARWWGGGVAAMLVLLLAVVALYEHFSGRPTGLDTLIVADTTSDKPGLMSAQTATYLLMMAASLLLATVPRRSFGIAVFVLSILLSLQALIVFSGYCFNAVQLFGQSMSTRTSPHTLACMLLLAVALTGWRAQHGYFSALIGKGLGSRLARRVFPFVLLLPFAAMLISSAMAGAGWLSPPVAVGLTIAVLAAALCGLVSLMGRRINTMERGLRELSLTDDVTGVLNYRGFALLGEQSFLEAQRNHVIVTLLIFNIENIKEIGEDFGNDVGVRIMRDIAGILRASFAPADIVARTEGDEFAVIANDESTGGVIALMRVGEAMEDMNAANRAYRIRFSVGEATSDPASGETFRGLIERAGLVRRERRRVERVFGNDDDPIGIQVPSQVARQLQDTHI